MKPVPPKNLNPFARELLEKMAGHEEAAEIVIGGGVALSHYLEYRDTVDLDSWWRSDPRDRAEAFVEGCLKEMADRHGLSYRRRQWREAQNSSAGPELVLYHVERLELQRPLSKVPPSERPGATALRRFREIFCRHVP